MSLSVFPFVLERTTTTGAGDLTLVEQTGFRRFSDAAGIGATEQFFYGIRNEDVLPVEYEEGIGHMSNANTLVRDQVLNSSNSGAAVNFSAGSKIAVIDTATYLQRPFYASATLPLGLINQTTTLFAAITLNFEVPEDGDYLLTASYGWSYNQNTSDFIMSLVDVTGGSSQVFNHRQEPKDSGGGGIVLPTTTGGTANTGTNQVHGYTRSQEVALTAGVQEYQLQFAGQNTNQEAALYPGAILYVENARKPI